MRMISVRTSGWIGLATVSIMLASCASLSDFRQVDVDAMAKAAREKVLRAVPELEEDAKVEILQSTPELTYYLTSITGRYGQYLIRWHLGSNRMVLVSGQGELTTLPGAVVSISELTQPTGSEYRLIYRSKPIP
jgi:hypothetical protein